MSDNVANGRDEDRRVQKTRAALRLAFNELILANGYDAISAADVAKRANVGRSTFYEHFQGKDDLLAQNLVSILTPLADACVTDEIDPRLTMIIAHFWQNRRLARALIAGRARILMCNQLAVLIEERLSHRPHANAALPGALAAAQLAHSQLGLIDGWLSGRHGVAAEAVAISLHATSRAIVGT